MSASPAGKALCAATLASAVSLLGMGHANGEAGSPGNTGELRTRNVILVSVDGLRLEELFAGPDQAILENRQYSGIDYEEYVNAWPASPLRGIAFGSKPRLVSFFYSLLLQFA